MLLSPDCETELQTNSGVYHSIEFEAPRDLKEIEFLLGDLFVNEFPLTDYDRWVDYDDLLKEGVPARIYSFLENLPDYIMEGAQVG
jgi:hypothetical protein